MSYFRRNGDAYSDDGSDIDSDYADQVDASSGVDYIDTMLSSDTTGFDRDITAIFRRIMNPNTLLQIIFQIERRIGRKLRDHERESIKQMSNNDINAAYSYRRDPTNKFYLGNLQHFSTEQIIKKIANRWLNSQKKIQDMGCAPEIEDIHEILRREIGTTAESGTVNYSFNQPLEGFESSLPVQNSSSTQVSRLGNSINQLLGITTKYELQKVFNPLGLISHNYIYLDSRLRNTSATLGINKFQWDEDNTGSINPGKFSYLGVVRDIVELKVYPFRIPYASDESADTDFRSITIYFEEFTNQAFIGRSNRRFHIICQVIIEAGWINLNPYDSNNGIFKFDKPLTEINKMTVSFGAPITLINFDNDRADCTFTYGFPTIITFVNPHNMVTGDIVSFLDFTSLLPIADAATIALMNTSAGLTITDLTPTTFSVDIDTTAPFNGDPNLTILCIFDAKTFQIPIELTFIRPNIVKE